MALSKLAGLYVDAARPADALRVADECIAIVGSYPDGHFARGRALIGLGRYDEARASFEESIRAGSSTAFEHFVVDDEIATWKAHNEIGGTFVIERRFAEARQRLELALKVRPKERTLLLNVARCCEAQGDLSAALANFRAVLETFQDEPGAIEYVNYVFRHESADGVLAAVETALPVLGDDYRRAFLTSAAAAMLRVQRRAEAAGLLRQVLAVGDESAGRAVIQALAQHYKQPELNDVLAGAENAH
jgi:tetratricopeptide (TPR) repeat protein